MQPKPTKEALAALTGMTIPDIIAPGLRVLFCGINPGLYSAYTGHHFARPGNRFWKALYDSGFTPHLLLPGDSQQLLQYGLGVTNVIAHATKGACDLGPHDYADGAALLRYKVLQYQPQWLAMVGIGAYRIAFKDPKAQPGPQTTAIGATKLWVLPNPSGLNAHYTPARFAEVFHELQVASSNGPYLMTI